MFPGRFTMGQSAGAVRKSKVDGKQSMLPKPRRPGSTDRTSVEARRPSTSLRSSSAEPARATMAGARLSREASASKIPLNRRSRSQQADKYGQSSMTPLRGSHFARTATTPVGTPSEERLKRCWQTSLDRLLAFITVKDQRPLSSVSWQRAEAARVGAALAARGGGGAAAGAAGAAAGGGAALALIRPLTITRFVDICAALLSDIMRDVKLHNNNYVGKLPNLAKRFLYPGAVSKSWLMSVNTLHAFPNALAFIAYFLDLVEHITSPVSDEGLYVHRDELSCLRRDFLYKCWIRFQNPGHEFEDLDADYLQSLKQLLGNNEERVTQLEDYIKQAEASLEDEAEEASRLEEERLSSRRDALASRLRALRAERVARRARAHDEHARAREYADTARALDVDIDHITAEIQQLKRELESQDMSVSERAQLLDEVHYATKVLDSKRTLLDQVNKIMCGKELELAQWQKLTLDSCVRYKHGLIHLAPRCPDVAQLAIDEQELMSAACCAAVRRAVERLRALCGALHDAHAAAARARAHSNRQLHVQLEQTRAKISELKSRIARMQDALESEHAAASVAATEWARALQLHDAALAELQRSEQPYAQALADLDFWEKQALTWNSRLTEMREYIDNLREQLRRELETEKKKRADVILDFVSECHMRLDRVDRQEAGARTANCQLMLSNE